MLSLDLTIRTRQFSCSALLDIDYNSNHSLGCYLSDHYVEKERPVDVIVVRPRVEQKGLFPTLHLLAYLKLMIFCGKKEIAGDTLSLM